MIAMPLDQNLITDLTCALPVDAWTDSDSHVHLKIPPCLNGGWRIVDYQTDAYSGRCISTSSTQSAELTIPLARIGHHAVHIGLCERLHGVSVIEVRLTNDEHWQLLWATNGPLQEIPWRFADLTGQSLHIRFPRQLPPFIQDREHAGLVARLFSVRCTPLPAEHVAILEQASPRRMVYFNDGHGIFYYPERPGRHIVDEALEPFADSDWDTCCFAHGGADLVNYPSEVGTIIGEDGWDFLRPGDQRVRDNIVGCIELGIDPFQQAIEKAHEQKQPFLHYLRPQGWAGDPYYGHAFLSRFFREHPEYRCVEADGTPLSKLSIAFQPVREQLNAILQEGLDRGTDGICIVFTRGFPLVRYEKPVAKHYAQVFGKQDMNKLASSDPDLRSVWSFFVTQWIREVRDLLDTAGPSPMRSRRELAVMVGPDREWNSRFGIDISSWAKEGLIDAVLPYPRGRERTDGICNVGEIAEDIPTETIGLLPSVGSWSDLLLPLAKVRQRAHSYYQQGATGLSRWDTPPYLARLGLNRAEEQALWCDHYLGRQDIEVIEMAGLQLKRFEPMIGF